MIPRISAINSTWQVGVVARLEEKLQKMIYECKHIRSTPPNRRIGEERMYSIHVWYIYLHVFGFHGNVGKYTIHGRYGCIVATPFSSLQNMKQCL